MQPSFLIQICPRALAQRRIISVPQICRDFRRAVRHKPGIGNFHIIRFRQSHPFYVNNAVRRAARKEYHCRVHARHIHPRRRYIDGGRAGFDPLRGERNIPGHGL